MGLAGEGRRQGGAPSPQAVGWSARSASGPHELRLPTVNAHPQRRLLGRALGLGLLLSLSLVPASCLGGGGGSVAGLPQELGFFLDQVHWGRLVDVVDVDGDLVANDVLVDPDLIGDGANYELSFNPVTETETLKILQQQGTAAFDLLLADAQANLREVSTKGPADPPPFAEVPRNAAIRLTFSLPVDATSVDSSTIQVLVGDQQKIGVTVRYLVQNDTAAGIGRVILDPTVSALQAAQLAIPQNSVGFPASVNPLNPNLEIRIPTTPDPTFGQPEVLRSASGKPPSPRDPEKEPTVIAANGSLTLVRAMRTGGAADDFSGFLRDERRPNLIGLFSVTVDQVVSVTGRTVELTYHHDLTACEDIAPKVGDVFEIGNAIVVVTAVLSSGNPAALDVRGRLESGALSVGATGLNAQLTTRYAPVDAALQPCYLEIQPPPASPPTGGLDPWSSVTVRFDEPVDELSMLSTKTFVITSYEDNASPSTKEELEVAWFRQVDTDESVADYVDRQRGYDLRLDAAGTNEAASEWGGRVLFGPIEVTEGNRAFTLAPLGGFSEINDDPFLAFAVALRDGPDGIRDLAGNPVDFTGFVAGTPGQAMDITVSDGNGGTGGGANAQLHNLYFGLFGGGLDENDDGLSEYAGQVTIAPGMIGGRPPERFSRQADGTNPTVGARSVGAPQRDPLNPAGAVTMHAYRPQDFGFGYPDPTEHNMDIEGLSWAPNASVVFDETFNELALALAHATTLPDESFDPLSQLPIYPGSGLVASSFDENILGFPAVDEKEVFRATYAPRTINLYSSQGVSYLPWPSFSTTYTWRDTGIPQDYLGGATDSVGSPNLQYIIDTGSPLFWLPEQVPSVGLALLMRFRCYPQADRLGLNQFTTTQMQPASALPAFRLFSAGGQDGSGTWFRVQPDNPAQGGTVPSGGFLPGGGRTPTQFDTLLYWMNADFVVRVSRVYTHWFDLGSPLAPGSVLGEILEPDNPQQPSGTEIVVEYRGSVLVGHGGNPLSNPSPLTTADLPFDGYGDSIGVGSVSTPGPWTEDLADLEAGGFRYVQVRFTFISNADLQVQPYLDGLGIAYLGN